MLKFYIMKKAAKLSKLKKAETFSLLNGMDEGLVVISAADKKLTFASGPAVRLLKQLSRSDSKEDLGHESVSSETIDR